MKRKFALLLTAALAVSCLAGCGNSVGNGNGGDVQTSSTVSETADKGKKENITLTFGTHQSGIPPAELFRIWQRSLKRKRESK